MSLSCLASNGSSLSCRPEFSPGTYDKVQDQGCGKGMKLSPEERQPIYQEKTSAEARQRLQQEPSNKPKKSGRLRWWLVVIFGLILLGSLLEYKAKPPPAQKVSAQIESEANTTEATYDACNAKLQKAKELDMLSDVGVRGASIQVLVGPTYFTVSIDEKKEFAEVVNCVLLKGAGGGIAFDLVHWQTGKRVASWNGYRLDVD